jgi:hypothetical protein
VHNSQLVCGIQTIGDFRTQVQDLRQNKADRSRCSPSTSVRPKTPWR